MHNHTDNSATHTSTHTAPVRRHARSEMHRDPNVYVPRRDETDRRADRRTANAGLREYLGVRA